MTMTASRRYRVNDMMLKDCGTLGGTRIPGEKKISGETPPQ
jgi:hypothetical protein